VVLAAVAGAMAVVVVALACWVIVRGVLARDALLEAAPLLASLSASLSDPDAADPAPVVAEIRARTADAVDLTSDPGWRLAELMPIVGADLAAVRRVASSADLVARDAVPPLLELAGAVEGGGLLPHDGRIDLAALAAVTPAITAADASLAEAVDILDEADGSGLVPPVDEAVARMRDLIGGVAEPVSAAAAATDVLPGLLGADGPRDYLLVVQNNAELRATGGIPGAVAVIHVDEGMLRLGVQSTAFSFPAPAAATTPAEQVLYGDNFTRYLQNVTMTPDFARTGELARTLWERRTGLAVDGVIAVDPVALAAVLDATGPIALPDGTTLDAGGAVQTLLSDTYARFPVTADQDAFFAAAAAAVFERVVAGGYSSRALLAGLAEAAGERRILAWSAHPEEQAVIAGTAAAGEVPASDETTTAFGVYFVDNTEGKMSFYLASEIRVRSATCRADGRPDFEVAVALESTAPADAAAVLPPYVLGGRHGLAVLPGQVRTTVFVFAPGDSGVWDAVRDGSSQAFVASAYRGHQVAGLTVALDPGERTVVTFRVLGAAGAPLPVRVDHTPAAGDTAVSTEPLTTCPTGLPSAPVAAPGSPVTFRMTADPDDARHLATVESDEGVPRRLPADHWGRS
jgi:hypothetical protein